ncbi:hypothetical protein DVH24_031228 [Malus domestica]|uniref:Uncharacterized protein n=1 Tax=Malus domestica TaxID=3750 RepID=A0A498HHD1_MALDO|nr:hypothetical protein DVH24_031228 [Malus domestica]
MEDSSFTNHDHQRHSPSQSLSILVIQCTVQFSTKSARKEEARKQEIEVVQRFQELFTQTKYKEATELAADTVAKFRVPILLIISLFNF